MKNSYQIYLINLDRAEDRLKMMDEEFRKAGVSYERISAVDAKTIKPDSYKIKNCYNRDLISGEIGCYLSHVKTIEEFLDSQYEFAVIIEDDAVLSDDFKTAMEKAMSLYNDMEKKHQWDVLKLMNGKRRNIKVKNIDDQYFIGACGTSIPITTIAAIWTRKGAHKFLIGIGGADCPTIKRPIDCELQHPWEFGDLLIYNLLPSIVTPAPVETMIGSARKAVFLRQQWYEIRRLFPKYFYYIKHHGFSKFYESFIAKRTEKVG